MRKSLPLVPKKERPAINKEIRKLSKQLQLKRIEAGYTQESLAERLDVSASYIAKIETCSRIPSVPMLFRIARALGIKITLS